MSEEAKEEKPKLVKFLELYSQHDLEGLEMFPHLCKVEKEALNKWLVEHVQECKVPYGAIGGKISYVITPTGVGVVTLVKCVCGKQQDITDYDTW